MIFNMTGGGVKKTLPVLNAAYPADTAVTYSGTAVETTFEVRVATDGYPAAYSYQWYVNDVAVANATRSTYTLSTSTKGVHTVYCTVTSEAGTVYSRTANLTVNALPVLNSSYPSDTSVTYTASDPASATFNVVIDAAGYPTNYTYQWYVDNNAVSGATSSSYTMTGLNSAATHSVYCKVTNDGGSVNSRTATLSVSKYVLLIYDAGTQHVAMASSGYMKSGSAQWGKYSDYATRGSVTFNDSNIRIMVSEIQDGPGAINYVGTTNTVDVSRCTTLNMTMSSHTHGSQAYLYLAATPTKVCPGKDSGGAYKEISSGTTRVSVDVSTLDTVYVVVTATAYDSTAEAVNAYITKIWAE